MADGILLIEGVPLKIVDLGDGTFALKTSGGITGTVAAMIADGADVTEGALADAAVTTDAAGSVSAKLRGLVVHMISLLARLPAALGANGGLKVEGVAGGVPVPVAPLSALLEGGLTELVGVNEQVDQNDYSGSVGVALGGTYSGEILAVALYATEDGTGAVQDSAGKLIILDADPNVASGDTALSAAEWPTVLGVVDVAATDWVTDGAGGVAYITDTPVAFHALATLYFVWLHKDATSLNDGAGDDVQLELNFWYRRDS